MEFIEYLKWDVSLNGAYELPEAFFTDEDGIDVENGMKYLIGEGLITNNSINYPEYDDRLLERHPGAYRFLTAYMDARKNALMDKLVEKGYVQAFFERDQIIYRWTQLGVDKLQEGGFNGLADG